MSSYSAPPVAKASRKRKAPPVFLQPSLNKEEINLLPLRSWEGEVILVQGEDSLCMALDCLQKESVLGFDTETKPTFTKGKACLPALIQLASSDAVYLIQLTHIPFDKRIAELLSSPDILKAGVAIHDDMKALSRLYPFVPGGVADLAAMARSRGIQAQGLRTLAANLLGFRISKSAQCSNWENRELSPQQVKYAATDAWIGRELYFYMVNQCAEKKTSSI